MLKHAVRKIRTKMQKGLEKRIETVYNGIDNHKNTQGEQPWMHKSSTRCFARRLTMPT